VIIDHRGLDIAMAQKLLDRSGVIPVFEKVSGERMAEGMTGRALCRLVPPDWHSQKLLEYGVEAITAP
jgi:hypothetical protein